ncbi:ATP-dependent nuclease [Clostridium tunisiense]|uniref:ATP-dependent nuclease n=1 Tax=Clostridium tunisiense TaxID=219748 RepID=UPI0002D5CCFB|nr:AAA family ATPase [Clostridium tunisiense]
MKLKKVEIKNYRLLESIEDENSVEIKEGTTILVGKNNSGKTSFSYIFDTFFNNHSFYFEDFSIDCYKKFEEIFQEYIGLPADQEVQENFFEGLNIPSIELRIIVEYDENDNWSNIRPLLTTLDENNIIKINFEYSVENKQLFLQDLKLYYDRKKSAEGIVDCIKKIYEKHFSVKIKSFSPYESQELIRLSDVNKIIGSCFISAQRSVDDSNGKSNSKLSNIFQKQYKEVESKNKTLIVEEKEFEELNGALVIANDKVDEKLMSFFEGFTKSFSKFGYPNIDGANIILKSNVTPTNIFSSINMFYKDKEYLLPEKYNGLGYSNLIYIISEILHFKSKLLESHTDLNLIFIEEPEAHMHPQLQSTFITKLNEFLEENGIKAQVIVTTHSSHIVASADFESIRYFSKEVHSTKVKDLMKFNPINLDGTKNNEIIKFLKQYISLVKCDMFFADKIILIEGVCERLLMPLFIKKVDDELKKINIDEENKKRLLSEQYISVIEIGGAYMNKFKDFLEFLNVKTLMITDIDCCKRIVKENKNGVQCTYEVASEIAIDEINDLVTTNQCIIEWMPSEKNIKDLVYKKFDELISEPFAVSYQRNNDTRQDFKCGRTFEEEFIIENSEYIFSNKDNLSSIKNHIKSFGQSAGILENSYGIYKYIDNNKKKSEFAFDLMYINNESWVIPMYIKEGLLWLAK